MSHWSSAVARDRVHRRIPYAVEELLPQSGALVLLDRVLEIGENHIVAEATARADGLFSGPDGAVPAWIGMEYMAQCVAAYSGYHRKRRGQPVELGFLLGTRHYECSASAFAGGERLEVSAAKMMDGANGMSVFDCRIGGAGIHAAAKLNVLLPRNAAEFLAGKGL
jgi:predicted hotdog family 3-hydroxylacyl-ACP dehydratase